MRTALAALGLAVLLGVPAADAALRIAGAEPASSLLRPDVEVTDVVVRGDVDCSTLLGRRDAASTESVTMLVKLDGDGVMVSGPGQVVLALAPCLTGATTLPIEMTAQASVNGTSLALQEQEGRVAWRFADSPLDEVDPAAANATFSLAALPHVVVDARFDSRLATMVDRPLTFNATVSNLGNVAIELVGNATLALTASDEADALAGAVGRDGGAQVAVTSVHIAPGASALVTVTVGVPSGRWQWANVRGTLTATSVLEPADERTIPFEMLLSRGELEQGRDAPSASLAALLGLLALAAMAARRRGGRPG